jgi:L-iditol 2-dehydrogenase
MTSQCERMVWLRGTYAEAVLVPAPIVAGNLHHVPDGVDPLRAALAENLACVLKGRDRTPARPGEQVVVLGAGAMGLLWTRVLALTGGCVTAVDRLPARRELALELGAEAVEDAAAFAARAKAGAVKADLVVEVVGTPEAWETALLAAAPGGRVHFFGGPPDGSTVALDTQRMHYDELTLFASFHHTPYHFAEALRGLAAGLLDPGVIVREHVPLEELPGFFRRVAEGNGPPKAAVVPG